MPFKLVTEILFIKKKKDFLDGTLIFFLVEVNKRAAR